eukprot:CAMPEP_0202460262 /NCGR_PEP_ID=MMETSP1360-20130828/42754_1 /ASSEMBLY_ACC=CAM_ASM_000848 /TAXON_ID=515479 /ORGANISM="Licmophora paradoxa, Strain CCMP2313" /LENGTH=54 /DNA_ID=CAMNT_0049081839 /DNA_START=35 /DNA_END=196 /DNA_ORIENTATION=+
MKSVIVLFTTLASVAAFAPNPTFMPKTRQQTTTELEMIGGLLQGLFGTKDAEIS